MRIVMISKQKNVFGLKLDILQSGLLCRFWIYLSIFVSLGFTTPVAPLSKIFKHHVAPSHGYLIRVGQSLNLTCPYTSVFYSWTRSGLPVTDQRTLHIPSAGLEDSGRYTCEAVYGHGRNAAYFSVRVINPSSYIAQRECMIDSSRIGDIKGPCFLVSYTDRDLNPTRKWGTSIVLDCETVSSTGSTDGLIYTWHVKYPQTSPVLTPPIVTSEDRRLLVRSSASAAPSNGPLFSDPIQLSTEPKLHLNNLNLKHNGEYRCMVNDTRRRPGRDSLSQSTSLTRTFRLNVKPRTDGPIIKGPRTTNETIMAGKDGAFKCEVNPHEHRSSTIRWGKSVDQGQRMLYESQGREVINWAGGTFVILPSISYSLLAAYKTESVEDLEMDEQLADSLSLPSYGAVASESSESQSSTLLIHKARASDAGRYVCSVLTEVGRDDHKFVYVTVLGATDFTTHEIYRLAVYIAVPTGICLICIGAITYCLFSRRNAQNNPRGSRHQRTRYLQNNQIKSPSGASGSSIVVCRNGVGSNGGGAVGQWNANANTRLGSSPGGTGPGQATLVYSSTNGSNSLTGVGQMMVPPVGTNVSMVPSPYPVLLQSMTSQPGPPYYTLQDVNSVGTYAQNAYPIVTGSNGTEMMLTTNRLYPNNIAYSVATEHGTIQNGPNLMPPTIHHPSPDSSAVGTGPGSSLNQDAVDGRLMFQVPPPTQAHQPGFSAYSNTVSSVEFGYHMPTQPAQRSTITSDYDLGQGNNIPLLSYHARPDVLSQNTVRA